MRKYTAKQGDCVSSIAHEQGFFWKTIWDSNPELRHKREDPNLIFPGDEVLIPEKAQRSESGETEQRHRYRLKGVPAKFRLIVELDRYPIANKSYVLKVDGQLMEGSTDDKGLIEVPISPSAKEADLEIEGIAYKFAFGALDPLNQNLGIQERLQNLGFYHGELNGELNQETRDALWEFQDYMGIDPTGELDDETRDELLNRHDAEHDTEDNTDEGLEPDDNLVRDA
jgi:N-acetylmuramoyl-L-alanine amidase